jgi:hypothetical protein
MSANIFNEVADTLFDMEYPLMTIRDFMLAIGYICEGGAEERLATIHCLANQVCQVVVELEDNRFQSWRALNDVSRGTPAVTL